VEPVIDQIIVCKYVITQQIATSRLDYAGAAGARLLIDECEYHTRSVATSLMSAPKLTVSRQLHTSGGTGIATGRVSISQPRST
jgi:hypothetical protein